MRIYVDGVGKRAITELCDVAVRTGGLANVKPVQQVLQALKPLPTMAPEEAAEPAEATKDKDKGKDGGGK